MFLSCGLLQGEISRLTLAQADRILQTFLKVFTKLNKGDRTSSHETDVQGGPLESEQELKTHPREERVQFVDDLKRGEFKFVTDKTEGQPLTCVCITRISYKYASIIIRVLVPLCSAIKFEFSAL